MVKVIKVLILFLIVSTFGCLQHIIDREHVITAKLAYLCTINQENLTEPMKVFLKENHGDISDANGREMLRKAFDTVQKMMAQQGFAQGFLSGQCMSDTMQVCAYYGFPECKNLVGQNAWRVDEFFSAVAQLKKEGEKLWQQ